MIGHSEQHVHYIYTRAVGVANLSCEYYIFVSDQSVLDE